MTAPQPSRPPARRLVLASASPRRRELLAALGLDFTVAPTAADERSAERRAVPLAEGLALRKLRAAAADPRHAGSVLVAADTVVVLDGRPLGKPADAGEARALLVALRGRTHAVVTGVAVGRGQRTAADHAQSAVTMRDYDDAEIERYVASGAPFDKAGGYAIQDTRFAPVARCDGCECAVIGLPLWTLRRLLRAVGGLDAAEPPYPRCRACPLRSAPAGGSGG